MRRQSATFISILVALLLASAFTFSVSRASAELPSEALSGFPAQGESAQSEEVEETSGSVAASTSSGSSSTIILVLIAAGVVLAGIAFVIVRDARKSAPVADGPGVDGASPARAAELRRRRAKAKAARRQRARQRKRKR